MSIAVSDFLRLALMENRVARAGDVPAPDDMGDVLLVFNELLDSLNGTDRALYTSSISIVTLTPNLQPHTIGLAANAPTFSVPIGRPTRIRAANLTITAATPTTRIPLNLRDEDWWMNVRARLVTSSIPTDLFYSDDWPNGSIYLWPVPTTAYGLELDTATLLSSVALTDTFDLPYGYQLALRLTTAEAIANMFGQPISPDLQRRAREARGQVWGDNDVMPTIVTRDAGMPGGRGGGFNFLTGDCV